VLRWPITAGFTGFEGGLQATVFWQFKDRFPDGR
jgi:hypothetical protein